MMIGFLFLKKVNLFCFILLFLGRVKGAPLCDPGLSGSGYVAVDDYWLAVSTNAATYTGAKSACAAAGAILAMPRSQTIFDAIHAEPGDIWIGLENPAQANCANHADCAAVPLKWANGDDASDLTSSPATFTLVNANTRCLRQKTDKSFQDVGCTETYKYACQYICPPIGMKNT